MKLPRILLGPTVSMDRIAPAAVAAGVQLVLPKTSERTAKRLGLPIVTLPSFTDNPAAALQLNELLDEHDITAFWPLGLSAFDLSGVGSKGRSVHPVTTPEMYELIKDKATYAQLLDASVRPVGVETFGADATLKAVALQLEKTGSAFVKPCRGINGDGCSGIVPNGDMIGNPNARMFTLAGFEEALRQHEAQTETKRWLVTELLYGPELSVDALCIHGTLVKWMVREKVSDTQQISYSDHPVIEHVRRLVQELGLHGVVSIQYMYDQDEDAKERNLKSLEINLRPSGGCSAYGEIILESVGSTGLLHDWFRWMTGQITSHDIKQWQGDKVQFRTMLVPVIE